MKKIATIFLLVFFSILIVGCGAKKEEESAGSNDDQKSESETLTITHELGETKVKKNPEKVVVFDFGILDSMDKLGIEATALPKVTIPSYLSKFEDEKYENVGSLKEPDFEKISEIQPDLIIISARQMDLYDQFSEIAPTIYLGVDTSKYMESFTKNTETLGKIFGKEAEVEKELAQVDESIKGLHEKASASGKNALIVLANEGKVSAFGPSSRFGLIHDVFGFEPVDNNLEVSTHGQSISFEYIVEKDPDYLFVIDRGAAVGGESSAKQVIENDLVKNTKAYKEGNIVYLDPDYWYLSGGGLVSVQEMVNEVEGSLK